LEKEKIHDLKKELITRPQKELVELCLSMAKLKTENKEMLSYLLFDSDNPLDYAIRLKDVINEQFETLNQHYYYSTKMLRKTLRLINKYSRFTKFKQGEIELLLCFAQAYTNQISADTKHQPLLGLQYRSLTKARQLIGKLHEDLISDYSIEYNKVIALTTKRFVHWPSDKYQLSPLH